MDIFVRGIPPEATTKEVKRFFSRPLSEHGIKVCHVDKSGGKTFASITVLDVNAALRFLQVYGVPAHAAPNVRPLQQLYWHGKPITCLESNREPGDISLRTLEYESTQPTTADPQYTSIAKVVHSNAGPTRFSITALECGVWDYSDAESIFVSHFAERRRGTTTFGLQTAAVVQGDIGSHQTRVDLSYTQCENIVLGTYKDPTVTFTLQYAPKVYHMNAADAVIGALDGLSISSGRAHSKPGIKTRWTSINVAHAKVIGLCTAYRIRLEDSSELAMVRSLLKQRPKIPAIMSILAPSRQPAQPINVALAKLKQELTDGDRYGRLPFGLRWQIERLARNGLLTPSKVMELLPPILWLRRRSGDDAVILSMNILSRSLPVASPEISYRRFLTNTLVSELTTLTQEYEPHALDNPYAIVKRYQHIKLVHKIIVTPTMELLEGPVAEPANRVLRRYSSFEHYFVRVLFQDEDGSALRYDPRASNSRIFNERLKGIFDTGISVADRRFSFLGFSHSSLRSQTCWFMAPFLQNQTLKIATLILKDLGDFSNIRVPAKCAARIGQNFTDTTQSVDVHDAAVRGVSNIERNGRDFADGCGTISKKLLQRVWKVYGTKRQLKPTALQIRFKGSKGMLSLDTRLTGDQLVLRPNMRKFETSDAVRNLEICGAALNPLPMVLNRPLIKVLEDLSINPQTLLDLQQDAVNQLRYMTHTPENTYTFLKDTSVATAVDLPSFVKRLASIGIDYHEDEFLYGVVEMAVLSKLREIKYRGRIPVPNGITLFGVADETGILKENEIFIATMKGPQGRREVVVQDRVAITRSPVLHPGDVQLVSAVNVPANSPLQALTNVVVFSQHGSRDLPSKLSGGDLDGDLYNILLDHRLIPNFAHSAADYPRASALELNRPVELRDMSDFFVKFMESDVLGMICSIHLQLADQKYLGTRDPDCLTLASLASIAVDYSKTGIAVNMSHCPKYDRCRPDFMAPSPRLLVSEKGFLQLEEEVEAENETLEGLDAEWRPMRYYRSEKILGELYRAIDETRFLAEMQEHHHVRAKRLRTSQDMMHRLWLCLQKWAADYAVLFQHQMELARDIRYSYEKSVVELLYDYAPSTSMPVSEREAFAGSILGRQAGVTGRPLRELSTQLKERFETVVDFAILKITRGEEMMKDAEYLDARYGADMYGDDREFEALPRALACVAVTREEPGLSDRRLGELKSFQYIAASVALKEWERYMDITVGNPILPGARVAEPWE